MSISKNYKEYKSTMGKKNQIKKKKVKKDPKNSNNSKKKVITKPQSMEEFKSSFKTEARDIKNKMKRNQVHFHRKGIQNMIKMKERKKRQKLPQ